MKTADLSGSNVMPTSKPTPTSLVTTSPTTINKTGSNLVGGKDSHKGEEAIPPGTNVGTNGKMPGRLSQARVMTPHVDVHGFEPPVVIEHKEAQATALRGKYLLDSYEHVKKASAYFDEWWKHLAPADRHEYACNMVKRADALGIPVSDTARKYGSETFAVDAEVKMALDARRTLVEDEKLLGALNKLASTYAGMGPEMYALTLQEFDKEAGLTHLYDSDVPDPFFSTYGIRKEANFSETIGNITVGDEDLVCLASKNLRLVKGTFTEAFAEKFRTNPVGTYKSMPVEQRKILANMAREQNAGAPGSG